MIWTTTRKVGFSDIDAAGIVHYPRYFEMISSVVEEFFESHLDYPFAAMHLDERRGIPTVEFNVGFHAPGRLGEVLDFALAVPRVGRTSALIETLCTHQGAARWRARQTIVRMDLDTGRPEVWPETIAARLRATGRHDDDRI